MLNEIKEPATQGLEGKHSRQSKQYLHKVLRKDQLWYIQETKLKASMVGVSQWEGLGTR